MNRAFTIYVPDDCELDAIQMTVVVKRKNGTSRGCTFFNKEELRNDEKWLFITDGKARHVKESEVANGDKGTNRSV